MHQHIKPGLYIDGLERLCAELSLGADEAQPRAAGIWCNWSFEKNLLKADVLTFANTNSNVNRVKLLPYLKNGTSYTASDNCPVITGPLSGCIMRGFKKDGAMHVAHVHRTKEENERVDREWKAFEQSDNTDLATKGHLADWFFGKVDDGKYKGTQNAEFKIWAIALPVGQGWKFYEFLVHGKAGQRLKVKKIYW